MKKLFAVLALLSSFSASAATYVGEFNVMPEDIYGTNIAFYWENNPAVYSAREAAALLFGGVYSDYAISTVSSLDPTTITHSARYAGWSNATATVFNEDFKLDLGGTGYNSFQGDQYLSAYSAYVGDGVSAINYVWRGADVAAPPVPEPSTYMMMMIGLGLFGMARFRRKSDLIS